MQNNNRQTFSLQAQNNVDDTDGNVISFVYIQS